MLVPRHIFGVIFLLVTAVHDTNIVIVACIAFNLSSIDNRGLCVRNGTLVWESASNDRRFPVEAIQLVVDFRTGLVDSELILSLLFSDWRTRIWQICCTGLFPGLFFDPRGLPRPRASPPPLTDILDGKKRAGGRA